MQLSNEISEFPLVSIIMPAFNAASTIAESIQSVLDQEYRNFELLIIDDNSLDITTKIVSKFCNLDHRVRLLKNLTGKGVASARNLGINVAKGKYLAFLDADDGWHQSKLSKQINFMISESVGFSFTSYYRFHTKFFSVEQLVKAPKSVDYEMLLKGNSIGCLTVIIDRKIFKNIIFPEVNFDEHDLLRKIIGPILGHEDYALWLSLLAQDMTQTARSLEEPLAFYRISNSSLSGNKIKSAVKHWAVLRRFLKLPFFTSVWYFVNYIVSVLLKYKIRLF